MQIINFLYHFTTEKKKRKKNTTAEKTERKHLHGNGNLYGSITLGNKDAFFQTNASRLGEDNCLYHLSVCAAYLGRSVVKSLGGRGSSFFDQARITLITNTQLGLRGRAQNPFRSSTTQVCISPQSSCSNSSISCLHTHCIYSYYLKVL